MGLVWNFISGLGSIVGLMTGAFVLYDRIIRCRPKIYVIISDNGIERYPSLVITNTDERVLQVRIAHHVDAASAMLVPDDKTFSLIQLLVNGEAVFPIGAGSTATLEIKSSDELQGQQKNIDVKVQWKYLQSSSPFRSRWNATTVTIDRDDYRRLFGEKS